MFEGMVYNREEEERQMDLLYSHKDLNNNSYTNTYTNTGELCCFGYEQVY